MLALIGAIALANLMLGFVLAMGFEFLEGVSGEGLLNPCEDSGSGTPPSLGNEIAEPPPEQLVLPPTWAARLGPDGAGLACLVTAAAKLAAMQVRDRRSSLEAYGDQLEQRLAHENRASFADILEGVRGTVLNWLGLETEIVQEFARRREPDLLADEAFVELEQFLAEQIGRLEAACANMDKLYWEADPSLANKQLSEEVSQLLQWNEALATLAERLDRGTRGKNHEQPGS